MSKRSTPSRGGTSFNRRDFLKGSGATVAASAMAAGGVPTTAEAAIAQKQAVAGPTKVTLNVNGEDYEVTVEPRTSLLDVLRYDLNLTGCKDLEDVSVDGADTVIIDGKATYASTVLALQARGKEIRTVESLRDGGQVDEVVSCFVKHDAMQCGYCTPGFVAATRAFLDKNPDASLEEIQQGLGGNICRCGTYDGITRCALELTGKGGA
ncbi:MAG: (2Fe-2S)-binding protein [Planctomycetota bacterium]|nr:MAG: (2Fe-2S)-binding protein [Planctomycetota bacterium]REK23250.1 MAG: (2Fe-2S)-binding protein [Planctomycetota bacterium]REK30829.1 MAG: (2Fe-2S)-binding protein [Planctomycetota bacterium]